MPNPGIFHGLRLEFLVGEMAGYSAAVANGTKDDFTKNVLRRFFKRFPPELPADEEPSEDDLAEVDDSLPDEDLEAPDPQDYAEDQRGYNKALKEYEARQDEVLLRSAQIVRWFAYRHSKPSAFKADAKLKTTDTSDPLFVMTCRLLGKSCKKPRKPIAYNLWAKAKANKPAIEKAIAALPKDPSRKRHNVAAVVQLKKDLFDKEPGKTRRKFEELASAKHKQLVAEWEANLSRPASKDPVAQQMCIDGVTSFMQPILDLVVEYTGLRGMLLLGGNEPAAQQLNVIGIHSGFTKGPVKMNFAEAEPKKFYGQVIPAFSDFLRKCYTLQDIKDSAISVDVAPLLSVIGSKEVTYCAATGDAYSVSRSSLNPTSTPPEAPATTKKALKTGTGKKGRKPSEPDAAEGGQDTQATQKRPQKESPTGEKRDGGAKSSDKRREKAGTAAKDHPRKESSMPRREKAATSKEAHPSNERSRKRKLLQPSSSDEQVTDDEDDSDSVSKVLSRESSRNPWSSSPQASRKISHSSRSKSSTSPVAHSDASSPGTNNLQSESSTPAANSPSASSTPVLSSPPPPSSPSPSENGASSFNSNHSRRRATYKASDCQSNESASRGVVKFGPPRRRRAQTTTDTPGAGDSTPVPAIATAAEESGEDNVRPSGTSRAGSKRRADDAHTVDRASKKHKKGLDKENEGRLRASNKRKSDVGLEHAAVKRRKPLNNNNEASEDVTTSMSSDLPASAPPALGSSPPSTTLPSLPALPPSCCTAIQRTREMVAGVRWGPEWHELITNWLQYESSRNFEGSSWLKATHRPSAVGEWIQRARNPYYRPEIDAEDFQDDFWKWWKVVQPEWRDMEAEAASRSVEGDWCSLDKAGKNGLSSVVAALFFWGSGAGCDKTAGSSWIEAVEDVSWVLEQLRSC
ncbi:hypothetical protein CVT26_002990 [Gymnopilus dilepis]|uniref:Uncharacterized protein n=1 Tax=Gymnopilus dilepis TaxID=231916 RepID=A0A409Y4E5_9AGAR|nr:hypothetical protein CVT26_002990 [Gymnopilus dilepis]